MIKTHSKPVTLGSVHLGAKFTFRTAEILGEHFSGRKPLYEGEVLTIVGFKPKYQNNVVVREVNGRESLLPLEIVEKALKLKSMHVPTGGSNTR
jgi:hypothetical protein